MAEEGEISFFAKCKGWEVVKKCDITAETEPQEIVAILTSISDTTARKAFDFSGIDKATIDAYAAQLTKGRRKAYSNVAEIFTQLKPTEVKERLLAACKEEKLLPIAEAYLMRSVLGALGFSTTVSPEMIAEIWPELKIPKPRGRMPKK